MEPIKESIALFDNEDLADKCKDQFDCLLEKLGRLSVADLIRTIYDTCVYDGIAINSAIRLSDKWTNDKDTFITFGSVPNLAFNASMWGWTTTQTHGKTWEPAEVVSVLMSQPGVEPEDVKYELKTMKPVLLHDVVKTALNSMYGAKGMAAIPADYECDDQMVSHPPHYQSKSGLEVIDVIEAFTEGLTGAEATNTGNIIKYACRWKNKNGIQDLKKILWYTQRLINHLEKEGKTE